MTLAKRLWQGLFLALFLFITSCAQVPSPTTSPSTRAVTPLSSATPYGGEAAQLGPLPKNCPVSPSHVMKTDHGGFGQFDVPAVGLPPVWIAFFGGYKHYPLAFVFQENQAFLSHNEHGWGQKVAWIVAKSYHGEVTIAGHSLEDGAALFPEALYASTKSTPTLMVLDPSDPALRASYPDPNWGTFVGGLTVPHAGCYLLEATWKGGQWRITFAAGTVPTL
jgi:hypothetical protein